MRRMNVVDSPPGITSPSRPASSSGFRTSTGSAPRRRSIAACSRKFPCTARTPILMGPSLDFAPGGLGELPAAGFEQLFWCERCGGETAHRVAQAARDAGEHLGILEVRRRLDDCLCPVGRVVRLEDSGADEDAVRAE